MSKKEQNKQAVLLRRQGVSIRQISKTLEISTSTASLWCRDTVLTSRQRDNLNSRGKNVELLKSYALMRHNKKILRDKDTFDRAKNSFTGLSPHELFLVGLALYWAEGFKTLKEGRVGFCNSDPRVIKFIMNWFRKTLKIPDGEFVLRAEFNIQHSDRQKEIEAYWANVSGIAVSQFSKPYFQKTNQLRDYSNKGNYYGLLRIKVRRSSQLLVKLLGSIEGLSSC